MGFSSSDCGWLQPNEKISQALQQYPYFQAAALAAKRRF
ncbi:hypothetical protein VCRA2123O444_20062 [Vibrio crassostreae]|nr:hypothetical protein VCRA2113O413_20174 [Vibrio crassostreae]CAK1987363.1 hypothetical protein VCRA2114O423_20174 [Vibrio crassostreae]CAK1988473.1 hypothetical protein VCRA2113O412_20174 [Vibrio crassostreae]CAK1994737.1 hypothetical protein VCRA2113O418_20171 [Vibrio crassostreae]CAK2773665.1 hypothetical protein VCRA2116O426_20174 [Vibrio crassostreae]